MLVGAHRRREEDRRAAATHVAFVLRPASWHGLDEVKCSCCARSGHNTPLTHRPFPVWSTVISILLLCLAACRFWANKVKSAVTPTRKNVLLDKLAVVIDDSDPAYTKHQTLLQQLRLVEMVSLSLDAQRTSSVRSYSRTTDPSLQGRITPAVQQSVVAHQGVHSRPRGPA